MASLQGTKIKDTFKSILKVADNGEIEVTGQEITDGLGAGTGVSLNTQGDVIATGTVSFASLKDSGENITITKFVDEADGISNNDNDTSIPTSAAVRDYVDNNITAQDLDITDGTNTGAVDLDSQSLLFTGDAGVSATVSGQTVTFDSSALQSQITSNDNDITGLLAADVVLQTNITAEATTRSTADSTEQAARIAADTTLQTNITAEETARIAADYALSDLIDAEAASRAAQDAIIETDINTETAARIAADATLQFNIDAEATTRENADNAIQAQITSNDSDIAGLDTRVTAAEGAITSNNTDIAAIDTRLTTAEGNITSNDSDISGLDTRLTTAEGSITTLQSGKQDSSEKGQANGYTPLDAGAKIDTIYLPDSIVGQLQYEGTWDAATNTPTLADPTTVKGHYYVVNVEGTYLGILYHIGDWIVSNGTIWEKVDNTDAVTSVFGRLGAIVANESDYSTFYPLLADFNAVDSQVTTNTSKLATIETGADVTDATNVAAAGALMSGTAGLDDLADVSVPTPSNGQVLTYNGTSGQWEAVAAGAAPVDSVNGYTGVVVLDPDDLDDTATVRKFTTAGDITKLAGIEAGADITDATNVTAALATIPVTAHSDVTSAGSGAIITSAERTKLQGIETGAQVNTVDSVNAQTGVVVLDADDISDAATTNKFTTAADISKLAGIEAGADVTDVANVTTAINSISVTEHSDVTDAGSGAIITSAERTQLQNADTKYTPSIISGNTNAVKDTLYVMTATLTLTLPASPSVGDKVALSNLSGTTTPVVARNGNNIMGLAEDLTIDVANAGIELRYADATNGWVIL